MIQQVRVVGAIAVITATIDFNPLRKLSAIAIILENQRFKGEVLFDLLALNGLAQNRFVSIKFDGHSFNRASLAVESSVATSLIAEQNTLAKNDIGFLQNTVLSSEEIADFLH